MAPSQAGGIIGLDRHAADRRRPFGRPHALYRQLALEAVQCSAFSMPITES